MSNAVNVEKFGTNIIDLIDCKVDMVKVRSCLIDCPCLCSIVSVQPNNSSTQVCLALTDHCISCLACCCKSQ